MQTSAAAPAAVIGSRPPATADAWGRVLADAAARQAETPTAAAVGPVLTGRPGLNKLQVAVSDGKDQRQAASATFFLRLPVAGRPPYAAVLQQQRLPDADATMTQVLDGAALARRQSFVPAIRALNAGARYLAV